MPQRPEWRLREFVKSRSCFRGTNARTGPISGPGRRRGGQRRRWGGTVTTGGGAGGEKLQRFRQLLLAAVWRHQSAKVAPMWREKKGKLIIERRSNICPQIFEPAAKRRRGRYSEEFVFMPSVVVCGRGSRASSPKSTQPGSNKRHLSRAVRSSGARRSRPASVALQSSGRRPGAVSPAASCQDANAQQMFRSPLPRSPEGPRKVVQEKGRQTQTRNGKVSLSEV